MTTPNHSLDSLDEILDKFPCIACDGSGAYQINSDGEVEQCQFCYQFRFPYIEQAKQAISEYVEAEKVKIEKAFGGCKKCYGKGYATTHQGQRSFDGSNYHESPKTTHIKYCTCSRGKQLATLRQEEIK